VTFFFTADTHFGHRNVLRLGEGRPFDSIEEHDEALVRNWNSRVGSRDVVYHLGDLSFLNPARTRDVLRRLRGRIHVVQGNHDRLGHLNAYRDEGLLVSVDSLVSVPVPVDPRHEDPAQRTRTVVMCHYPLLTWEGAHRGAWMLHGHCHGTLPPTTQPRMDVGVDCTGYAPISFEEVAAVLASRDGPPPDQGRRSGDHQA
jgi:calcineurin-like phosphoesterase family protein